MKSNPVAVATHPELVTAVSLHGGWLKWLEAQRKGPSQIALLAMKARRIQGLSEEQIIAALKELVKAAPGRRRGEVVGLIPTGEVFTRYLRLPSDRPEELKAMAHYQLEGLLPFSIQECVTSVKVMGPAGEATRVLAAAVHRPVVDRLVRISSAAGLRLTRIAASGEAIGDWHKACCPEEERGPSARLFAELTPEGMDLGILHAGQLVYLRQVSCRPEDLEEALMRLRETLQAYTREQVGPPVEQVSVSGAVAELGSGALERIEAGLELPVHRLDPLERSPFRESLSVTAGEVEGEVSFSELLGAAWAGRLLALDLLPAEIHLQRVREAFAAEARRLAALLAVAACLIAGWIGAKALGTRWTLRQTEEQIRLIRPAAARVQAMAGTIRSVQAARTEYGRLVGGLAGAAARLPAGVTLQFLGLDAARHVTVRGTAADLSAVAGYVAQLRGAPEWEAVMLRSAKGRADGKGVEFEILLRLHASERRVMGHFDDRREEKSRF